MMDYLSQDGKTVRAAGGMVVVAIQANGQRLRIQSMNINIFSIFLLLKWHPTC
jgi:hypothetical protein